LLHNKILDGESGIHFNRPCHRYLGIRAMQQFPVMKIGFCKNAIGFCKQPDTFRSLIYGQAIYYKTLLSLRWSFLIDVKSSGLRI
jgi:hypothetical protein